MKALYFMLMAVATITSPHLALAQDSTRSIKKPQDSIASLRDSLTVGVVYLINVDQINQFDAKLAAATKRDFWSSLGAIGNVMQTTSTGFSFGNTLDKFTRLKTNFARAFQVNITPVNQGTNIAKYDTLNAGIAYAVINNYHNKDYENTKKKLGLASHRALFLRQLITNAIVNKEELRLGSAEITALNTFYHKTASGLVTNNDLKGLSDSFIVYWINQIVDSAWGIFDALMQSRYNAFIMEGKFKYEIGNKSFDTAFVMKNKGLAIDIILEEYNETYQILNAYMKKEQLNLALNSIYNTSRSGWQGVYFAPNYTNYFGCLQQFSYTVKEAASMEYDSLHHITNFNRVLLKTTGSIDWLVPFRRDSANPSIDLRVDITHEWVLKGLYSKEMVSSVSPTFSVTFNITSKLSVPLAITYNTKKANLFGLLDVQYTFGDSSANKKTP